ncbi:hypothetical protein DQ04_00641140 [Trypanosoma grayi]|uniref:hypothetical protein n=1 Tax=Trypanosoma grayi TaxID=71804 RepID=UPI0004F44157|nr:hypothetical protein DQ04_00641140 [Trypanosoma grayi]KEG14070.1 hypothetical protein DQ04_00641140 [Trypanosoma grayi]
MRSAASQREEIQKKLHLLRLEKEREQRAFDELASKSKEMTASEIAEAARKKAVSEEPTFLMVDDTTISVGDYVLTLDDVHALCAAENGIFVPDPVKQVYLGERGKVIRVLPSFQGKSAVEMRFADGAVKIFLTECLAVGHNVRKTQRKTSSTTALTTTSVMTTTTASKPTDVDPNTLRVPGFVAPSKPEPLPQPTWSTLDLPRCKAGLKENKQSLKTATSTTTAQKTTSTTTTATESTTNKTTSMKSTVAEDSDSVRTDNGRVGLKEGTPPDAKNGQSDQEVKRKKSLDKESRAGGVKGIGLVKEVLLERRMQIPLGEQLGSPINYDEARQVPLVSHGEHDNLLKTPRVDLMSYVPSRRATSPVESKKSRGAIPTSCPTNYKPRFSIGDKSTRIPRLNSASLSVDAKRCRVAGLLPNQSALDFQPIVFQKSDDTLDAVLSVVTQVLKRSTMGHQARRLFTVEGTEITQVNAIRNNMCLVATSGEVYSTGPTAGVKPRRLPTAAAAPGDAVQSKTADQRHTPTPVSAKGTTTTTTTTKTNATTKTTTTSTPHSREVAPGKGIPKPISVRVFSNGEYGDKHTDRFPFRTITLRPTHKTMKAVFNTIERELEWHPLGKRVESIYDATGSEITSIEKLHNGQAVVVSTGDRFVIPHPSSVLHEDVVKILESSNPVPSVTHTRPAM